MRCRRSELRPAAGQRGVALVVALLVFALCATLLVAMQREFSLLYQRAANHFLAQQSHAYLLGAEGLASLALTLDQEADQQREQPRDDLSELWAQPSQPYALEEGGWLQGELQDLQGRFNLNSLADPAPARESGARVYSPAQAFFIRLLLALETPRLSERDAVVLTEAIGDWLDADDVAGYDGAEDDYYAVLEPAYRTANRPMASVSELRSIATMTPALYAALQPLVTVWPQTPATMNIHTMSLPLLRAVNGDGRLEPLPMNDAQLLLEEREETGFIDMAAFLENAVFSGDMNDVAGLLGESSDWFLLWGRAEIADRDTRLYSVLHRQEGRVVTIARAMGSL